MREFMFHGWLGKIFRPHPLSFPNTSLKIRRNYWKKAPQYIKLLIQLRKKSNLPVYLSKLRSSADVAKAGSRFNHFIKHGFLVTEQNVIEDFLKLKGASDATDGFFSVSPAPPNRSQIFHQQ